MLNVKDVIYEDGNYWVLKREGIYYVMVCGNTCSESDSAYAELDLAIARCDYLSLRHSKFEGAKFSRNYKA